MPRRASWREIPSLRVIYLNVGVPVSDVRVGDDLCHVKNGSGRYTRSLQGLHYLVVVAVGRPLPD